MKNPKEMKDMQKHWSIKVNEDKTSSGGKKEKWQGMMPMKPSDRAHAHKKTNECDY